MDEKAIKALGSIVSKAEKVFGYKLKSVQLDALAHIASGEDVLCVLPTGIGKSLIFQAAALHQKGLHIVISPLIALMRDQVADCKKRGIEADELSSSQSDETQERIYRRIRKDKLRLLYVSPEKLSTSAFRKSLRDVRVRSVTVDECHSVSSLWSLTFRPEYRLIGEFVESLPKRPRVACFTATCTPELESEIAEYTGLYKGYARVISDPVRDNLSYRTVQTDAVFTSVVNMAAAWPLSQGRRIVYVHSRKVAEKLHAAICERIAVQNAPIANPEERKQAIEEMKAIVKKRIAFYHAGMKHGDSEYVFESGTHQQTTHGRRSIQDQFKSGEVRVVIATSAFGMGVDVPDIREIVEMGIPSDFESYMQSSGRAGRDGQPSVCTIVTSESDVGYAERMINQTFPTWEYVQKVVQGVLDFQTEFSDSPTLHQLATYLSEKNDGVSIQMINSAANLISTTEVGKLESASKGWELNVNMRKCRSLADTSQMPSTRSGFRQLINLVRTDGSRSSIIQVSQRQLGAMFDMSPNAALSLVKKRGAVEESTNVTLTERLSIDMDDAPLDAMEQLETMAEEANTAAMARFEAVRRFTFSTNQLDKLSCIRSYFLSATV